MDASNQSAFKKRLKVCMNRPENAICVDCPERQPRWASLIKIPGAPSGTPPVGAFMCLECSGSHRRLGVHIAFVRSINLDSCKFSNCKCLCLSYRYSIPFVTISCGVVVVVVGNQNTNQSISISISIYNHFFTIREGT